MSYILDALRKSELERRPGAAARAPVLRDPGPARLPPHRLAWYALPVAVVLALGVGGYLLLTRSADREPAMVAGVDAASAPAPSASTPPAAQNVPAPVASAAVSDAPAPKAPPVRDLVEQTRITSTPASRTAARAAAPRTSAPAPVARTVADDARLLRLMPQDFQSALPQMVVNIHVYSIAEAERILYINNRQYHAGDKVRDDVVVEEIVEDGAVLSFRGQRFKLPRPS